MSTLDQVIEHFGGRKSFAETLKVTTQAVFKWRKTKLPSGRAIQIEELSDGKFTAAQLRPDLLGEDSNAQNRRLPTP